MPKKHVPRPIGGRIDKICKCCEKPFTIHVVRSFDSRRVYCSPECRKIANSGGDEFKTRICLYCGIEFQYREYKSKSKERKFCSAHCSGKYNVVANDLKAPRLEPRPCVVCGKMFSPVKKHNPTTYCSPECRKALYETEGTCEHCGKKFTYLGRLYRSKDGVQIPRRFCSKTCQHAAATKAMQERLAAIGEVCCAWCLKPIPFNGNITERTIRRYCSRKHCSDHQKFKNLRYCKWCGKRFSVAGTTNEGRARKRKPGLQQCCSHECYLASIDKNREGYRQLKTKICPMCNKPFTYHDTYAQSTRTYCSPLCKVQVTFKRRNAHE